MTTRRIKITKRAIDALRSTNPAGDQYSDTELRGFLVFVYATGAGRTYTALARIPQ